MPDGQLVTTVDTITEDQDFRRIWPCGYRTRGYDVGWKSVAQNLSDINAMGARPTGIVTSLSLPADIDLEWVESFAGGVSDSLEQLGAHGCAIVGGDVGRGREISVTTTAFGTLDGGEPMLRSGAKPGDVLAVCGPLGFAAAGLAVLEHPTDDPTAFSDDGFPDSWSASLRRAVMAQLRPRPRLGAGAEARAAGGHAMLDISDGLIQDAGRIAEASNVIIQLDAAACLAEAAQLEEPARLAAIQPSRWIFGGGEAFALLTAFDAASEMPQGWHQVGRVARGAPSVEVDGTLAAVWLARISDSAPTGWDPFAARTGGTSSGRQPDPGAQR